LIATASFIPTATLAAPFGWGPSVEKQKGDPQVDYETLYFDPAQVYGLLGPTRAAYRPRADNFAALLASTALQYVGQSRNTAKPLVSQMLELFQLPFEYKPDHPVPFCAAGLSYVVAIAYVGFWNNDKTYWATHTNWDTLRGALHEIDRYHFYPSPSVWDMYYVALGKRRWLPRDSKQPKPGWLVIYDFGGGADHVGLILSATATAIHTFECNTSGKVNGNQQNGGVIAIRDRSMGTVKGYIRTDLETPL
jgi:hypothetical protein